MRLGQRTVLALLAACFTCALPLRAHAQILAVTTALERGDVAAYGLDVEIPVRGPFSVAGTVDSLGGVFGRWHSTRVRAGGAVRLRHRVADRVSAFASLDVWRPDRRYGVEFDGSDGRRHTTVGRGRRWFAAGLDVALPGPPVLLRAGLEYGRIDADWRPTDRASPLVRRNLRLLFGVGYRR